MKQALWIWYFGDFELHHHKKICMQREERGHFYPAPWRVYDCNRQVRFRKTVVLDAPETVRFLLDGVGYIEVASKRYPGGAEIPLAAGENRILVCVMNETGIPAVYCSGASVCTDRTWEVTAFDQIWQLADAWEEVADPCVRPSEYALPTTRQESVRTIPVEGGMVYDFGKETFIKLVFEGLTPGEELRICYGESLEEAMDFEFAVISDRLVASASSHIFPARACRYVRVIGKQPDMVYGLYEYLPFRDPSSFSTPDEEMQKIRDVAEYTFRLNSRMFYQDGIKRDRWVWSGDAYQSYFFNYYSYFDPAIVRRTILALRGGDPIASHLNTIVDYSLYWLVSLSDYYRYTGDRDFLGRIYPRAKTLAEYCEGFENPQGFFEGREGKDWTFVDWSDMDKTGAMAIMQMLWCRACEAVATCAAIVGDGEAEAHYREKATFLREAVNRVYWNPEKGAYITTVHGEIPSEEVRRHANIFAVLLGFAEGEKQQRILENVLLNDAVPAITTPYFQLYELEALCRLGQTGIVTERMRAYWGGMLREGATTFWEEYDPTLPGAEQLGMYGWKFDKSLCHAWGAGPLYLLGRYYAGVEPAEDGYETFTVSPVSGGLEAYEITVPVKDGTVHVSCREGGQVFEITASRAGGRVVTGNGSVVLPAGETVRICL